MYGQRVESVGELHRHACCLSAQDESLVQRHIGSGIGMSGYLQTSLFHLYVRFIIKIASSTAPGNVRASPSRQCHGSSEQGQRDSVKQDEKIDALRPGTNSKIGSRVFFELLLYSQSKNTEFERPGSDG